jgi:hypothetical protein
MKKPLAAKNSNVAPLKTSVLINQKTPRDENGMSYQDYCKMKHQMSKLEQMIQFFQINMRLFVSQINNQNEILSERLKFVFFMFKMHQDISQGHQRLQSDKMRIMEYHIDLYDQDILRFEQQFSFFQDSIVRFYQGLVQIIEFQISKQD